MLLHWLLSNQHQWYSSAVTVIIGKSDWSLLFLLLVKLGGTLAYHSTLIYMSLSCSLFPTLPAY